MLRGSRTTNKARLHDADFETDIFATSCFTQCDQLSRCSSDEAAGTTAPMVALPDQQMFDECFQVPCPLHRLFSLPANNIQIVGSRTRCLASGVFAVPEVHRHLGVRFFD